MRAGVSFITSQRVMMPTHRPHPGGLGIARGTFWPGGAPKTHWRTRQMSDHLPMWVELRIDFSEQYLKRKRDGEVKPTDLVS